MQTVRDGLFLVAPPLITTAKVILAGLLSLGTVILLLTLSLRFEGTSLPTLDSAASVVVADVKNWEPIYADGPSDATKPDRQINVVHDTVVIGRDNWIVRFKVVRVVRGVFDSEEVRTLIHSPSQFGIHDAGERFVLTLRRRAAQPKVIASSHERLSEGLSHFTFAEPLFELVSTGPSPLRPAAAAGHP